MNCVSRPLPPLLAQGHEEAVCSPPAQTSLQGAVTRGRHRGEPESATAERAELLCVQSGKEGGGVTTNLILSQPEAAPAPNAQPTPSLHPPPPRFRIHSALRELQRARRAAAGR